MEKQEILNFLNNGKLAKDAENLESFLTAKFREMLAIFGRHQYLDSEQLKKEVVFMAKSAVKSIKTDKQYSWLRIEEIGYFMAEFCKGRFCEDLKDANLKNFFTVMNRYLACWERKDANMTYQSNMSKTYVAPVGKLSEENMWNWIEHSLNAYCQQQLLAQAEYKNPLLSKGTFAERDFGGVQKRFLVAKGYMIPEESFKDFLLRAIDNDGIFLKIA